VFKADPWARAFVAACGASALGEAPLEYAGRALECLRVYVRCALSLPGSLSGKGDALRLDRGIRRALEASGFAGEKTGGPAESARRFLFLMIRRGRFRFCRAITAGIERTINQGAGVAAVILESAFAPGEDLVSSIRKKILEQSGLRDIELTIHINPDLLGGLRLRMGSVLFDASIKTQLQKMAAALGE
jgi:F-type H+-transporting ATPase subunit delta